MLALILIHTLRLNNLLTITANSLCSIIPKVDYKKAHQTKRVQIFRRLWFNFRLSVSLTDITDAAAVRFFAQAISFGVRIWRVVIKK
jgi:hypothetical protein